MPLNSRIEKVCAWRESVRVVVWYGNGKSGGCSAHSDSVYILSVNHYITLHDSLLLFWRHLPRQHYQTTLMSLPLTLFIFFYFCFFLLFYVFFIYIDDNKF